MTEVPRESDKRFTFHCWAKASPEESDGKYFETLARHSFKTYFMSVAEERFFLIE